MARKDLVVAGKKFNKWKDKQLITHLFNVDYVDEDQLDKANASDLRVVTRKRNNSFSLYFTLKFSKGKAKTILIKVTTTKQKSSCKNGAIVKVNGDLHHFTLWALQRRLINTPLGWINSYLATNVIRKGN